MVNAVHKKIALYSNMYEAQSSNVMGGYIYKCKLVFFCVKAINVQYFV